MTTFQRSACCLLVNWVGAELVGFALRVRLTAASTGIPRSYSTRGNTKGFLLPAPSEDTQGENTQEVAGDRMQHCQTLAPRVGCRVEGVGDPVRSRLARPYELSMHA